MNIKAGKECKFGTNAFEKIKKSWGQIGGNICPGLVMIKL
jgi:hypothetical protein